MEPQQNGKLRIKVSVVQGNQRKVSVSIYDLIELTERDTLTVYMLNQYLRFVLVILFLISSPHSGDPQSV